MYDVVSFKQFVVYVGLRFSG